MAKKIILADSAGVCFGVEKAVSTAEEKLVQEQNVFSYGPLIHNPQTIEKLENKGLKVLDKIAYIRFASVYTNFKEIGEFGEYIDELHGKSKKK